MTYLQRDSINNPVTGLIIYCTDCNVLQYYDGNDWVSFAKGPPPSSFSNNPSQLGTDIDGEATNDFSGHSVSLSADGNTLAIGAIFNGGNGTNAGHVRIYIWNDTIWTQQGIDLDGEAANDLSGHSVSLSADGTTIAIGAYNNDGNGSNSGHVRVYQWNDTIWTQQGIDLDGEAANDLSGFSVSLSADGNKLAIGAIINGGNGPNSGHVRIFIWNGAEWMQQGADIDGEAGGDQSGYAVSLSEDGNTVAIGAPFNDGNGTSSGHVRVYSWNGSTWIQQGIDIDGETGGDNSGVSISLSADGNTLAIGAPYNDGYGTESGHVRVFRWIGNTWMPHSDIDGENTGNRSGYSVSLSADGNTLAIGAPFNNDNGILSGHVRVYNWNDYFWTLQCPDIDGEATDDRSGYSVSLSANGSTLAIGSRRNDGTGSNAGHVRVFK
jgi:hypothetical protein